MGFYRLSLSLNNRQNVSVKDDIQPTKSKKVLIVGGTGRVGTSTANSLAKHLPDSDLILAGRSRGRFHAKQLPQQTSFLTLDYQNRANLVNALKDKDLVIHAAGPFQRRDRCHVLEAALETQTPYLDVCDDMEYTKM